ncbi:hypothetical protein ACHAWF_003742 [Thalassiosira exigua]
MDPGWLLLFAFLLGELLVVALLCLPMPSNEIRGRVVRSVASLWENRWIQYTVYLVMAMDAVYFYFVCDALTHPLYDFGILSPVEMGISCQQKQDLYYNERNAYISGGSIFLFFVINRLIDIQEKLHVHRETVKSMDRSKKEE